MEEEKIKTKGRQKCFDLTYLCYVFEVRVSFLLAIVRGTDKDLTKCNEYKWVDWNLMSVLSGALTLKQTQTIRNRDVYFFFKSYILKKKECKNVRKT